MKKRGAGTASNAAQSPGPIKASFNGENSSLSGSMRKRAPLQKQYITVQKSDGDIGTIEVDVKDETFTNQQPILQSLAEMGEIPASPTTLSKSLSKPGLKALDVLRRGSMAVGGVGSKEEPGKIEVPEKLPEEKPRSGSAMLTPELLEDLKKDRKRIIAKGRIFERIFFRSL